MAKKVENLAHEMREGVEYALHPVAIDNGKTKVGFVPVEVFASLEDVASAIEAGRYSESFIVDTLHAKLAIISQQSVRDEYSYEKLTDKKALEIALTLDAETHARCAGSKEKLMEAIREEWSERKSTDTIESTKVWWSKVIR